MVFWLTNQRVDTKIGPRGRLRATLPAEVVNLQARDTQGSSMLDRTQSDGLLQLDHLAALEFAGADARAFLQGQLSSDVLGLAVGEAQLTSYSTPKGRVVAILRLIREPDRVIGVLPAELAAPVLERLRRYVLRAKVTLRVATELAAFGTTSAPDRLIVGAPSAPRMAADSEPRVVAWKRANIAAGIAQVYPATSELFVAQMLNLDLVNAISFRKGCYTGQEIIARTQNLGRVKRRMLRFEVRADGAVAVGGTVSLGHFGMGTVVEAASGAHGHLELLAVVHLEPQPGATGEAAPNALEARELPLPYSIPETTEPVKGR
jgi:folate-binding protein YgfZ